MEKQTILVIEDEENIRETIVDTLTLEGFTVLDAANGKIGIELANKHLPDLILSDVNMPEVDGFGVIKSLKEDPRTNTIPFIFLTARADKSDIRGRMNLGADDYLNKPFTIEELLDAINTRLKKKQLIDKKSEERVEELRTSISLSLPHELKTPLNSLLNFSEIISTEYETLEKSELKEIGDIMLQNAKRLNLTIEKYLLYIHSKFLLQDREKLEELRRKSSMFDSYLITRAAQASDFYEQRKNDLFIEGNTPVRLQLPLDYFVHILEELIDNSFRYSEVGSVVKVLISENETTSTITIRDYGRGMSEQQIQNIGEFSQLERSKFEQQGLGLGLAIAKLFCDLFSLKLNIKSEVLKGTTITIS